MRHIAVTITIASAFTGMALSASAEDATHGVVFDNAASAAVLDETAAPRTLFIGWQISYQMYRDAEAAGAPQSELSVLRAAADSAGAAYEASLIAQNSIRLAAAGPQIVSDAEADAIFGDSN